MASSIFVSSAQLRTRASELTELNQRFKTQVTALQEKEGVLKGMYEGDAATTFHNAFTRNKIQMDNFYNCIERYAAVLQEIAARWDQAEAQNQSIAGTSV